MSLGLVEYARRNCPWKRLVQLRQTKAGLLSSALLATMANKFCSAEQSTFTCLNLMISTGSEEALDPGVVAKRGGVAVHCMCSHTYGSLRELTRVTNVRLGEKSSCHRDKIHLAILSTSPNKPYHLSTPLPPPLHFPSIIPQFRLRWHRRLFLPCRVFLFEPRQRVTQSTFGHAA